MNNSKLPCADTDQIECSRCGTCCRKGGPSLHRQDKDLVDKGLIAAKRLFTFRQGEPVYDNVMDRVVPAATDIIKIAGHGGSWTCCFFADATLGLKLVKSDRGSRLVRVIPPRPGQRA